jgi:4-diphosphocytidyl-2-C-methyl-D-erythritol kinase
MVSFPNAKINIGLNITERRSDGYHNLETVFYPVKIKDILEVVPANFMQFQSSGLSIPGNSADNLCLKAYDLICQDHPLPPVHVYLHKLIPIGAGLGGGSADAAFFIHLLNDVFTLDLTRTQMLQYAKSLGADCAFFIDNQPAFATGVGDILEVIDVDLSAYEIVLVKPDVFISTVDAFHEVIPALPDRSLREYVALPVEQWYEVVKNDFEKSVFRKYPEIELIKNELYNQGAVYASMSGSGSSVYGIFKDKVELPGIEKSGSVFYGI